MLVASEHSGADGFLSYLAQSFVHPCAEELVALDFERLGRLHYKGGLTLERAQEGWFALVGSTLHVCSEDGRRQEPLQLRKLQELCEYPCPADRTPLAGRESVFPKSCPRVHLAFGGSLVASVELSVP